MPAEIPGYYFDAARNRYYKVQPNHAAPSGSNYSRQAVNAEKAINEARIHEASLQSSKDAATVTRAGGYKTPLQAFDRRLGERRKSTRATVAEYYAASLTGANAVASSPHRTLNLTGKICGRFATAPDSGALLGAFSYSASPLRPHAHILLAVPRSGSSLQGDALFSASSEAQDWPRFAREDSCGSLYDRAKAEAIQPSDIVSCIIAGPNGLVVWANETPAAANTFGPNNHQLTTARYVSEDPFFVEARVAYTFRQQVLDLAAPPSMASVAIATSEGVSLLTGFGGAQRADKTQIHGEQMVVAFKDENVFMSGARSGKIMLCDRRSGEAQSAVLRLQHSSAVSGLAAVPDGNRLIVNGLETMNMYDLRYAPPPSPSRSSSASHAPSSYNTTTTTSSSSSSPNTPPFTSSRQPPRRFHQGLPQTRQRHRQHTQHTPSTRPTLTPTPTPAVLSFAIPPMRRATRYGLAFAYDAELDIVLAASTDHHLSHRVGLWSASTGRMLKSPLIDWEFAAPVACAQISRVRDGPKSILLVSDGLLTEWSAQGRGLDEGQEWF